MQLKVAPFLPANSVLLILFHFRCVAILMVSWQSRDSAMHPPVNVSRILKIS